MKTLAELGFTQEIQNVIITPELAKEMLLHNTRNRSRGNDSIITRYEIDMETGSWGDCDSKIQFDKNERMLNGQKRCMAIVASGMPQKFTVELNVTNHKKLDYGQTRNVLDNVEMEADPTQQLDSRICNTRTKAMCTSLLYERINSKGKYTRVDNDDVGTFMKHYEQELINFQRVISMSINGNGGQKNRNKISCKSALFAAYIEGVAYNDIMNFMHILSTGCGDDIDDITKKKRYTKPVIALRDYIAGMSKSSCGAGGGGGISSEIYARTQDAIRRYVKGHRGKVNRNLEEENLPYKPSCSFLNKTSLKDGHVFEKFL